MERRSPGRMNDSWISCHFLNLNDAETLGETWIVVGGGLFWGVGIVRCEHQLVAVPQLHDVAPTHWAPSGSEVSWGGGEVGGRLRGGKRYKPPSQQRPSGAPSRLTEIVRVAKALQARIAKPDLDLTSSGPKCTYP